MVWEMQKPLYGQEAMEIQTSDFFDSSQLGHQWEFNHQPRHDKWSLHERKGFLRLHAFSQLRKDDFFSTGNVLSQRYIRWGKGEAVAKFDIRNMSEGQEAGLAHFNGGKDYACIVVAKNNGKLQLLYKTKSGKVSEEIVLSENLSNRQRSLWFKTEIGFSGKATFGGSTNGKSYNAEHGGC